MAELDQISVGNDLLLHGLWLCMPTALSGGAIILEHPAPPHELERFAIWRTGLVLLLLREGWLFKRRTFRQGHFGAPAWKPTTLLHAHCPIADVLAEHADRSLSHQLEELIGRDSSGSFRTAKAKEYPSQLCMCFGLAFWQSISKRQLPVRTAAIDAFAQNLERLSGRVDLAKDMLPDYQPRSWQS